MFPFDDVIMDTVLYQIWDTKLQNLGWISVIAGSADTIGILYLDQSL